MVNLIFKIMTHPKLERFRVWIPYPIYVAIITGLITTPFILFLIPKGPLSVLQLIVVPLAFPSLLAVASFTGYLSGYRPFVYQCTDLSREQVGTIGDRLSKAAESAGFHVVWRGSDGSFVAVYNMQLERNFVNNAKSFPMRVSFTQRKPSPNGSTATFKLQSRTTVFWDSGEGEKIQRTGEDLLGAAGIAPFFEVRAVPQHKPPGMKQS